MTKRPSDPLKRQILALDEQFRHWLTYLGSCIDGRFSERDRLGARRCIACHVRRAGRAGTGYKPLFSAVPMTFAQHDLQHTKGETALRSEEWFEQKATEYLERWLRTLDADTAYIVREYVAQQNSSRARR